MEPKPTYVLYFATDTGSAGVYREAEKLETIEPKNGLARRLVEWIEKNKEAGEVTLLPNGWYAFMHRASFPKWIMEALYNGK